MAEAGEVEVGVVPVWRGEREPRPEVIAREGHLAVALPPEWTVQDVDLERDLDRPRRPRGTVHVHDAASFAGAITQRGAEEATIYADDGSNALVAVLNDDQGAPGWRDYRVALALVATPEWTRWRNRDGMQMDQAAFAEHIEDSLAELQEPAPADMLEIAQRFHATTSARFKTAQRLASGETQFAYEEELEATAGTLAIPERIKLVVAPFVGTARYELGAWLRYRVKREAFTIGYKLDRPQDVERAAFADIRQQVQELLPDLRVIAGPAPQAA